MKFITPTSTYVLGILFPILDILAVVARFRSRKLKKAGHSWDDYLAVPALLCTSACGIIMIIGAATNTIGSHNDPAAVAESLAVLPKRQILFEKLEFAFWVFSYLAIGFIRLVFLFLFHRIFRGRAFTIVNRILIGLVIAWTLTFFILWFTDCGSHPEATWGPIPKLKAECINTFAALLVMSVSDFAIDLSILIMPFVFIWQLKMRTETKVGVSLVFLLAGLSVALSCARMVFMIKIMTYPFGADIPLLGTPGTSDPIGVVSITIWFTMLELGVAAVTMNLPVIPGLFPNESVEKLYGQVWRSLRSIASPANSLRRKKSQDT